MKLVTMTSCTAYGERHVLVAGSLGDRGTTHSRDAFGPRCNKSSLCCFCSFMGLSVVTLHDIMARARL